MSTSLYPRCPTCTAYRGASSSAAPYAQTARQADRTLLPAGTAGAPRLPDFSIFLPRAPFAAIPDGIPASTLKRSGFVL